VAMCINPCRHPRHDAASRAAPCKP
jgi:hypothetical protein